MKSIGNPLTLMLLLQLELCVRGLCPRESLLIFLSPFFNKKPFRTKTLLISFNFVGLLFWNCQGSIKVDLIPTTSKQISNNSITRKGRFQLCKASKLTLIYFNFSWTVAIESVHMNLFFFVILFFN